MTVAHSVAAHPASQHSQALALLWIALVFCLVATPIAWLLRCGLVARAALRRCPACGSSGVRAVRSEPVDLFEVQVHVHCGQCGAWRRLCTDRERLRGHARAVARDKRRMTREARRLGRQRAVAELRGFAAVLRSEIVGADDFLACTTPPRPLPRGG